MIIHRLKEKIDFSPAEKDIVNIILEIAFNSCIVA